MAEYGRGGRGSHRGGRGGMPRGGHGSGFGPGRGGGHFGGGPQGGYGGGPNYDSYGNQGGYGGYGGGWDHMAQHSGGYPPQPGYGPGPGFPPGYGFAPPPETAPSPLDEEIQLVMNEMTAELAALDQAGEWADQFKNARRLLIQEKDRLENSIDPEWLEVDIVKPIKVTKKVLIPIYRHPKVQYFPNSKRNLQFNFVGKILGPKGATLQTLCKTYKCHIYVLGRGSTKDINKEQELLMTNDPQYAHYGGPLHVKIETVAPSQVAYKRVAGVIEELSRILQPVREDTTPDHMKDKDNGDDNNESQPSQQSHETHNNNRGNRSEGGGPMRGGRGRGGGGGGGGGGGAFRGRGSAGRPQPY